MTSIRATAALLILFALAACASPTATGIATPDFAASPTSIREFNQNYYQGANPDFPHGASGNRSTRG